MNSDGTSRRTDDWCARLYESKAAQLILYGRALGLSHAEAEDTVQEVFQALLALERCPENPEAYAVRSVRNRGLNFKRGLWRRVSREWKSRNWFETDELEDPREAAAMRCLERLPMEQREVLVLKVWHGHTFEEIGTLLGISPNTASGRYRYGLERLRTVLNGANDERLEQLGATSRVVDASTSVTTT